MIGETLGAYRIDRELGSGGMGRVYAATVVQPCPDLAEGTRVALKVIRSHLLEEEEYFRRFIREAEIGTAVRHENVVRTYLADTAGEQHFLVMEYVEGQTLRQLLDELDRIPEELCRHVGGEIARGLAAIHAAGAVHRDLKPDNVLITAEHRVKVMDLGVARLQDAAIRLSQSGVFVGSVEYAAPEQFRGGDADHRADLHALGVLLYELSAGRHPYRGKDFRAVMRNVLDAEPSRLGDVNPQLSPFFEEAVHRLLAKDPADRFGTAEDVARVLDEGEDSAWWLRRASVLRSETHRPLRRIRVPRETAVYGRDGDLAALRALYERARDGEGQVALIEGEAGIGKSRLVDELVARLQADGEDVNFLFGSYPPGGAAMAAGGFSSAFREHFGPDGSADYLEDAPLLAPGFDALLRGEPLPEGALPLTRGMIETCVAHATRALAVERPTLILIDDLHFAPEEARGIFTSLSRAVPGHRVLLIGTARPGLPQDWIANLVRPVYAEHVHVDRLGAKDLTRLLVDAFHSDRLAEELGFRIAQKSDGNPFFVFEIIRGLREGQFISQREDGTWVTTKVIEDIRVPSSVLDLVNARVADLTEEQRDLLDVASCWGFEFDPGLVGDVLGLGRIPVLKRFGQIERAHRLVRSAGRKYVFDHHQVQEALYRSLNQQLREEYHAALATALEGREGASGADPDTLDGALCVDLCEHFLAGARGESALGYLAPAEAYLHQAAQHGQAIALVERALAAPGLLTGTARAEVLLRICRAAGPLDLLGRRGRQEDLVHEIERLAEEADDDRLRCQAAGVLGVVLAHTARHVDAEPAYRRAIELAASVGDRRAEAVATGNLGTVLITLGRLPEARECVERRLAMSRASGDRSGEALGTANLGNLFFAMGRPAEAREWWVRALAIAQEVGDRLVESSVTKNIGGALTAEGRLEEAREYHERGLAMSRAIGNRWGEALATANLGLHACRAGRLEEAEEYIERSRALSVEVGDRQGEARAAGNLAVVLSAEGRLAESREQHERQRTLSRELAYLDGEARAEHNLGAGARDEGDLVECEERLRACLAICRKTGDQRLLAATLLFLGSVRVERGDAAGGRGDLEQALEIARDIGVPGTEVLACCELAALPGGDVGRALASFHEHEEHLNEEELPDAHLLLWRATGDLAHLRKARHHLDESLAYVPVEYHESVRTKLRLNRDILAACEAQGIG